jgi:hypothetical protein
VVISRKRIIKGEIVSDAVALGAVVGGGQKTMRDKFKHSKELYCRDSIVRVKLASSAATESH